MVSVECSEAITEVIDILDHMERFYIDKIPEKFKQFLIENKSKDYESKLDHTKKLKDINLKQKTRDILSIMYLTYWSNPNEKAEFENLLQENEGKYQEELSEKYNPNDIFKKPSQENNSIENIVANETTAMVEYKESIFKRIINKIKSIFIR